MLGIGESREQMRQRLDRLSKELMPNDRVQLDYYIDRGQQSMFIGILDLHLPYAIDVAEYRKQEHEKQLKEIIRSRLVQSLKDLLEHLEE